MQFAVDPVHFGMVMLLNLGIGLWHPAGRRDPVCRLRRRPRHIEQVVREIWPFYGVMFLGLMLVLTFPRSDYGCRGCSDCEGGCNS
jgi:TRAP-type C4-dicarboxylate transport system permease large subunit